MVFIKKTVVDLETYKTNCHRETGNTVINTLGKQATPGGGRDNNEGRWNRSGCDTIVFVTCPYNNPTATIVYSVYNVEISKPLAHTTPYTLWGQLDILPNSLKQHWRWLMGEKIALNSLAAVLVDIHAVSMLICVIVLCDKTAHFRVAFSCPQHKVLWSCCLISFLICHTCQVDR